MTVTPFPIPEPTTPDPAAAFLAALARRDLVALEATLAPDLWFRALLPRRIHESHSAADAVTALAGWFDVAGGFERETTWHHPAPGGRSHLGYRFRLQPDWAEGRWHVIEQSGYARLAEGRIRRLDLVCTGFFPVE